MQLSKCHLTKFQSYRDTPRRNIILSIENVRKRELFPRTKKRPLVAHNVQLLVSTKNLDFFSEVELPLRTYQDTFHNNS